LLQIKELLPLKSQWFCGFFAMKPFVFKQKQLSF